MLKPCARAFEIREILFLCTYTYIKYIFVTLRSWTLNSYSSLIEPQRRDDNNLSLRNDVVVCRMIFLFFRDNLKYRPRSDIRKISFSIRFQIIIKLDSTKRNSPIRGTFYEFNITNTPRSRWSLHNRRKLARETRIAFFSRPNCRFEKFLLKKKEHMPYFEVRNETFDASRRHVSILYSSCRAYRHGDTRVIWFERWEKIVRIQFVSF